MWHHGHSVAKEKWLPVVRDAIREKKMKPTPQTKLAVAMMSAGVREVIRVKELADACNVSRVHLSYVMHGHRESPALLERAMRVVAERCKSKT